MIKTTTIKDYATDKFPPVFISDGNSGSFESQFNIGDNGAVFIGDGQTAEEREYPPELA